MIFYKEDFESEISKLQPKIYKIKKERFAFLPMGFDIETYTQYEKDENGQVISHFTSLYIWQFSINDNVFIGRTWKEFSYFINLLKKYVCTTVLKTFFFIHNASFEMSFMGRELYCLGHDVSVFARRKRKPMKIIIDEKIVALDSYYLTGYSLEKLAKNYTTTQKLVGDIDYTIPRHSKSNIDNILNYACNDVLILSEYAQIYEKDFLQNGFMPMTKTMIANQIVKDKIKELNVQDEVFFLMKKAYPKTQEFYDYIMTFYTGAYTHGMLCNLFITFHNGLAYDVTSEYPWTMLFCYMPMGKIRELNINLFHVKQIEDFLNTYCCFVECTLKNIKSYTGVTIISKNKIFGCSDDALWDNGRLYSASFVNVRITEIDIETLKLHYDFEIEYTRIHYCERGYLPDYFRLAICDLYVKKSRLKNKKGFEIEYAQAKANLNSMYGACACKVPNIEILFNEFWEENEKENDFSRLWKRKDKLPQWACYITAHSRALILKAVYLVICPHGKNKKLYRENYFYSDTDSCKTANKKYIRDIFDKLNIETRKENEKIVKDLKLDILYPDVDFAEMGTFLLEHDDIIRFKCLGSKRYITQFSNGEIETTVAGLPKKAFKNYCDKRGLDYFDAFTEKGLKISDDESMKLCAYYNDNGDKRTIIDYEGNVFDVETKSFVSLIPTTFNLKVTSELQKINEDITKLYMLKGAIEE